MLGLSAAAHGTPQLSASQGTVGVARASERLVSVYKIWAATRGGLPPATMGGQSPIFPSSRLAAGSLHTIFAFRPGILSLRGEKGWTVAIPSRRTCVRVVRHAGGANYHIV